VEDLRRCLELVVVDRDDVEVLARIAHHLLAGARDPDRVELVAQTRRLLVLEGLRRGEHVLFDPLDDRRGVAFEEGHEVLDQRPVVIGGDRSDARP